YPFLFNERVSWSEESVPRCVSDNRFYNSIDGVLRATSGHIEVVGEDRESDAVAAGRGGVSRKRLHMVERSGFGQYQSLRGSAAKPVCQRSVYSRHREGLAITAAPRLLGGVLQQRDHGMRRNQVLPRQPGSVVKNVLIARNTCLGQKSF